VELSARLSPHFTFGELTTTDQRQFQEKNRELALMYLEAGTALASLLESVRAKFDSPVHIHSGFRCKELNRRVGGSPTSQHMVFQAADFHVRGADLETVFHWIWKESGLSWGQLILEGFVRPSWLHLSLGSPWRTRKNGQVLRMLNGTYQTLDGGGDGG